MGWAGWGAGPSGAGAAGTSKVFLAVALIVFVVLGGVAAYRGHLASAGMGAAGAIYFAFRLFGGLGRGR